MTDHDFAWIADHSSELFKKYPGKWIAVRDGCVVGVGDAAPQAAEKARQQVTDGEFILEAIDGSMPFLVEIANGPMGSSHLFEAAFQVRLQRGSQAGQLPVPAHLV